MTQYRVEGGWFLCRSDLRAPARVVCFPHGGGDPRAYADWQTLLGDTADVLAVCIPGRGRRGDEPPPESITELAGWAAGAVAAMADRPTYLFGHSLGAVVAFEVARRLRSTPMVRHLVASGCAAPALLPSDYLRWAAGLDNHAFAKAMVRYEGMSPEIVDDPDVQDLLLADLRADCRLIAGYRYQPAAPLQLPLSLVNGRDDWRVSPDLLQPWNGEVTTVPTYHWRDGGHFYFADRPGAVVDVLLSVVAEEVAPSEDHVEVI